MKLVYFKMYLQNSLKGLGPSVLTSSKRSRAWQAGVKSNSKLKIPNYFF